MSERDPLMNSKPSGPGSKKEQVAQLQKDVDVVVDITSQNVNKVLDRGDQIDDLVDKSYNLETSALGFRQRSRKLKWQMCRQNAKMWGILTAIIVLFLIIIIIIATRK